MKPYYSENGVEMYNADWREVIPSLDVSVDLIPTDPPYNVGYGYDVFSDRMKDEDYLQDQLSMVESIEPLIKDGGQFFYLNYPEFAARMFWAVPEISTLTPYEWLTWTYNQHTGGKPLRKATRAWCWWTKGEPSFVNDLELQGEYRNPTDRRVSKLISEGRRPRDYDWWHYEQVKNVDVEKTDHPCQLPLEMVSRIIRLACPPDGLVLDPYCGSGTTARACQLNGRRFIGIEISEAYCEIAANRLRQEVLQFDVA